MNKKNDMTPCCTLRFHTHKRCIYIRIPAGAGLLPHDHRICPQPLSFLPPLQLFSWLPPLHWPWPYELGASRGVMQKHRIKGLNPPQCWRIYSIGQRACLKQLVACTFIIKKLCVLNLPLKSTGAGLSCCLFFHLLCHFQPRLSFGLEWKQLKTSSLCMSLARCYTPKV